MPHKTIEARREYACKWAAAHPGYGAASSRKRRQLHPDSAHEEYLKHKEAYVARSKAWQQKNPKKAKAMKAATNRKRWKKKRREILDNAKKWRLLNPEKVKAQRKRAKPKHAI